MRETAAHRRRRRSHPTPTGLWEHWDEPGRSGEKLTDRCMSAPARCTEIQRLPELADIKDSAALRASGLAAADPCVIRDSNFGTPAAVATR